MFAGLISTIAFAASTVNTAYAFAPAASFIHAPSLSSRALPVQVVPFHRLHRNSHLLGSIFSDQETDSPAYDLILVGSGNGACGFLARYLESAPANAKILILEQGKNFLYTSDITHQNAWTRAFSEGNIFKLHNARTVDGRPILSGRACTMGGGGSINYTMIHESSQWLVNHLGHTVEYWDALKADLNVKFHRENPATIETPITKLILKVGREKEFQPPDQNDMIHNITSYKDQDIPQLYQFPTQFNTFGQRTNSGVSLIDFSGERVRLETRMDVKALDLDGNGRCTKVSTTNERGIKRDFVPKEDGQVILCAGANSPRLLFPHQDKLQNPAIGLFTNDHIAMPLGIFTPKDDLKVSPKDIYGPVFATTVWKNEVEGGDDIVVTIDFFTGSLQKLLYMVSHLFLAFLPNFLKSPMLTRPWLFVIVKNSLRVFVSFITVIVSVATPKDPEFITAIVKYNGAQEGKYDPTSDKIELGWFQNDQDKNVAKEVLKEKAVPFTESLGSRPHWLVQFMYRLFTKAPFSVDQVDQYVEHYSKNALLSEQHMAGGCLFGPVLEKGEDDAFSTGLVRGTTNIRVADLSAVPLPRVSPQMTAYLVGFHVANQMYGTA